MSEKLYAIELTGQGDFDGRIVEQAVWDWIHSPVPKQAAGKSYWIETHPATKDDAAFEVRVTIGSYDNDRAIQALYVADSSDPNEFRKLAVKHCVHDTYIGGIY